MGIDPGVRGALAILDPEGARMKLFDMPIFEYETTRTRKLVDPYELVAIISGQPLASVLMEEVWSSPQMGVASAFSFGEGKGMVLGVLAARGIPLSQVKPQAWQKAMRCPSDPRAATARGCQLFPALAAQFKGPRGGVIDGRAEAAMIALHHALELGRAPTAPVQHWETT